jgi:hypothetical protein
LTIERKKSISNRYINENKSEITSTVLKVHGTPTKNTKKEDNSSINEVAKTKHNLKGLPEIIAESNKVIG